MVPSRPCENDAGSVDSRNRPPPASLQFAHPECSLPLPRHVFGQQLCAPSALVVRSAVYAAGTEQRGHRTAPTASDPLRSAGGSSAYAPANIFDQWWASAAPLSCPPAVRRGTRMLLTRAALGAQLGRAHKNPRNTRRPRVLAARSPLLQLALTYTHSPFSLVCADTRETGLFFARSLLPSPWPPIF